MAIRWLKLGAGVLLSVFLTPGAQNIQVHGAKTSYNIKTSKKNEIRFTSVSRIKQLDFGVQN